MGFSYTLVADTLRFLGHDIFQNPQQILEAIEEAGYDGVDLGWNPAMMDPKAMRKLAESVGLALPELLGAWAYFHAGEDRSLAGPDPEAMRRGVEYGKAGIDCAVELGAQFFEICAPQPAVPQIPFPETPIKTLRQNFVDSTRQICEYAEPRGITILFEPLNCYEAYPGVLTTLNEAISLINEIGFSNLGVQPDIFHMNIGEASIPDALRAAGTHVKHVHLNETNHRILGTGHADYKAIVRALRDINFTGYIAIYMPFTTQKIFQMASQGYGSSSSTSISDAPDRPDLKPYLHQPLKFMKELESIIEVERSIYRVTPGPGDVGE